MLKDRDIICISSIDWDFVWQGHQEIMSTFANNGNRVLYIENTGIRTPRLSDIGRLRNRIANWRKGLKGIREESKNLFICSPLILPFPYSRIARIINRFLLIKSIKAWMKAVKFENPVIWTFLPTSITLDIIDYIDHSLVVYYCIAEFSELAQSPKKVYKSEAELLKHCDLVFAQGQKIKERCQKHNKNVHIFPFGFKADVFLKPASDFSMPKDIASIPRPIAGYVGGIHKHIDLKLVDAIAGRYQNMSLVFVGPVQSEEAGLLASHKNVYFLGKKDHATLPAYIDSFDVCLIPYLITEYTKTVYPTKLNEYLMRGKRVLSTQLPEVIKFVSDFGDVVSISNDRNDFVNKLGSILTAPASPGFSKNLTKIADQNSWEKRIGQMSDLMESSIEKKERDALRGWKESFARMTKMAKPGILKVLAVLFAGYLLLFHTPLLWWAASPLKFSDPLTKADAIVVLGGGVGESGLAGQGYEERVKYAIDLYKRGYAGKLIFSSGYTYALQEAEVMKALALSFGVPEPDILLEKRAANTYQNVKFSTAIAEEKGYHRIILVSSPYHMLRLKLVADKFLGKGMNYIFSPIPRSIFYGDGTAVTWERIKAIVHEYLAILYYKFKGYA